MGSLAAHQHHADGLSAAADRRPGWLSLDRKAYGTVAFTDAEWSTLQVVFAEGVCNFSQPGVQQQPTIPWLGYQRADGAVIYGGKALGGRPENSGAGWLSPAFRGSSF